MIPQQFFLQKARESGVPESTIERDYAQNWLLQSLTTVNMVLKGGTGIRKVYIENYRFSDDLDFTLLEPIRAETIKELVYRAVLNAIDNSGINFSPTIEVEENLNGFEIKVYFRILRSSGDAMKIKLDITEPQKELILDEIKLNPIIHPYPDSCSARIKVYSLEEIMAEKIRALFERVRPRDIYDIWYLADKINQPSVASMLSNKFSFKKLQLNNDAVNQLISTKIDFANAWKTSLQHQIKELPEFDAVFAEVIYIVQQYINRSGS